MPTEERHESNCLQVKRERGEEEELHGVVSFCRPAARIQSGLRTADGECMRCSFWPEVRRSCAPIEMADVGAMDSQSTHQPHVHKHSHYHLETIHDSLYRLLKRGSKTGTIHYLFRSVPLLLLFTGCPSFSPAPLSQDLPTDSTVQSLQK